MTEDEWNGMPYQVVRDRDGQPVAQLSCPYCPRTYEALLPEDDQSHLYDFDALAMMLLDDLRADCPEHAQLTPLTCR
jgi:hypothetical protein